MFPEQVRPDQRRLSLGESKQPCASALRDRPPLPGVVRVLVAEDDPRVVDIVCCALTSAGYAVQAAECGRDAVKRVASWRPDVIVVGVLLSDVGVPELIRCLPNGPGCPSALFLSFRGAGEKLRGLTVAGNDCLDKPFSVEELLARMRRLIRINGISIAAPSRWSMADLSLDEENFEVLRGGRAIDLSPTEFRLLRYFMRNSYQVISRRRLLDHVWSYHFRGDPGVLDVYIGYLRRKLDRDAAPLLHTVRHRGFSLAVSADDLARPEPEIAPDGLLRLDPPS
jgi:two-component system, OmpR family, response regulator